MPKILISGASVAGPALAYWTAAHGWETTVVERADRLRDEGQNVDVRGAAREVVRWMGLEEAVRAANTGEEGTEFIDAEGETIAELAVDAGDTDGPTAELEILRGELARVLHDLSHDTADWVFGDHVAALEDRGDGVDVTFASGRRERFDVVAIAEGRRSATRELVFDDVTAEPLGVHIAYLTIPRTASDTRTWRWYNATGGRQVHLRPDNLGTTRAMLGFRSERRGLDELGREEQVALLREVFAGAGWQTQRVLDALDDAPLYFEDLVQIRAPRWSAGNVVLLGDAAHCVTPLGGGGTSLALVDAYVLARALATHATPAEAFAGFERFMRPHAEAARSLPPGVPQVAFPKSRLGVRLLQLGEKLAASDAAQAVLPAPASGLDEIELEPPVR